MELCEDAEDGVEDGRYLSARDAAGELGVGLPTLYAYVSRGLIRSEAIEGDTRRRRYRAEDVRRLKERAEQRRDPTRAGARAAEGALSWGMPVMESAITLISDGRLYYRGRDALRLAATHDAEQVAALIWTGDPDAEAIFAAAETPFAARQNPREGAEGIGPVELLQATLPLAASEDLAAYDLRAPAVARTGARILRLMAAVAVGQRAAGQTLARTLQQGWAVRDPGAAALLNASLVLCADHELNVSSFTARCVASSGAAPYAVVTAGLSALQGTKHGGQTELVEAFLREVEASGDARRAVADRLRRGEQIPGFGHSLYPEGDPRGAELLRLTYETCPEEPTVALCGAVVESVEGLIGEHPTVDFALVILARALGLPRGGAIVLFALGRTIGWIGHAIEQYESGSLIRPRARYVGEQPSSPTG